MPQQIAAHFLPSHVTEDSLSGQTAVVIDVLRATTTITCALAAGAAEVFPCLSIEEARQLAIRLGERAVLGGERSGVKIDGFELGNSPEEYSAKRVAGKSIVFTTTNGTQALLQCRQAARVLVAGFVNLTAVCRELAQLESVTIVCAGTDGAMSREDVLLAGALVEQLDQAGAAACDDLARLALDAWRGLDRQSPDWLKHELRESIGGRNLIAIGHAADIDFAAQIDCVNIAPELDASSCRVHLP